MKKLRKTNATLLQLIETMRSKGYADGVPLWVALSKRLSKPSRRMSEVNISTLNRYASENEIVVVPGKVLGSGDLDHKVTVAAFKFTESARRKIEENGKAMTLGELMEQNPTGSNVRIIGG
jgi:large subunit ribosomal protein L18e